MEINVLMEKYYTPTIEEFHVGFEYESLEFDDWTDLQNDKKEWLEMISTTAEDLPLVENKIKLNEIRVKCLGQSDIESFGFRFVEEYNPLPESSYGRKYIKFISEAATIPLSIWYANVGNKMHIWQDKISYFNGHIKNISELKTLFKQLGI